MGGGVEVMSWWPLHHPVPRAVAKGCVARAVGLCVLSLNDYSQMCYRVGGRHLLWIPVTSRDVSLSCESLQPAAEASYKPALHSWLLCQDLAPGVCYDYLLQWVNVIIIAGLRDHLLYVIYRIKSAVIKLLVKAPTAMDLVFWHQSK